MGNTIPELGQIIDRQIEEIKVAEAARFVAEHLGLAAGFLEYRREGEGVSCKIVAGDATIRLAPNRLICTASYGDSTVSIPLSTIEIWKVTKPVREIVALFRHTDEQNRWYQAVTVSARGRVVFDSNSEGILIPQHLIGGERIA